MEIQVEAASAATAGASLGEAVGIGTSGSSFATLLEPGCPLPCESTATFGTAEEGQEEILIFVFRGPDAALENATPLGAYEIAGFPPATGEGPEIAVTFRADADGISMSARDTAGGALRLEKLAEP